MTSPSPQLDYQPRKPKARSWREQALHEWHRFAAQFTRENIISSLKTLAWVVPLTLLIWIYAEREQVATTKDVAIPFDLVSNSPDRAVSLKPTQDKNLILELQGPQARLQEVRAKLSGGLLPQGLKIEVPTDLELHREHTLDTLSLVRNQRIFADNGVTVLSVQPSRLEVMADSVVERDALIARPPGAKNLEATFDPPTVKIRGPLAVLTRAEQTNRPDNQGRLVLYADLRDEVTRTPGHYDLKEVPLRRPAELDDEHVSIVAPPIIKASIDVRLADKPWIIRSMPVTLDVTDGLLDKYKVTDFRPVLQNVTVTGPPDIIDALQKPDFEPKPKARVTITQQDVGERKSKTVKYDLPQDVTVSDEDKSRTVEFRLVERSALTPPL